MYPIGDMYLHTLKSYVRNKSRSEGSIAEGIIINFSFYREHKKSIRVKPRICARDVDLIHTREFISWFEKLYKCDMKISHKRTRKWKKTHNSGVVVTAEVSSFASARDKNPIPGHVSYYGVLTDEMSHRRGRVQIVSPKDELDNLQQLSDIQPVVTTTPSSSDPFDSSDPSIVGMIKKIMFNFTYDKCVCMRRDCAIDLHTYRMMTGDGSSTFEVHLRPRDILFYYASSKASTSVSSTSIGSTYVDEIYTQVMGPERHGRVRGYGFGPTPTSVFGSTKMLIAAEQKFTTATEELSNVKEELSHVKETFEERLIEVQRMTQEEMKEEFEEK
ncbi:hypothetical protein AAG906_029260 [Vitis piasezkii]